MLMLKKGIIGIILGTVFFILGYWHGNKSNSLSDQSSMSDQSSIISAIKDSSKHMVKSLLKSDISKIVSDLKDDISSKQKTTASNDQKSSTDIPHGTGGNTKEGVPIEERVPLDMLLAPTSNLLNNNLNSFWMIKKRKANPVISSQNLNYFDGTNPYGPSTKLKEDLINDENLLSIDRFEDKGQTNTFEKPITFPEKNKFNEDFNKEMENLNTAFSKNMITIQEGSEISNLKIKKKSLENSQHKIVFGTFNNYKDALTVHNFLKSKGYEVGIFKNIQGPLGIFSVKLKSYFNHKTAIDIANKIKISDKLFVQVVEQ